MADNVIQLPIEVTGNAEAQIKKISDAVGKLDQGGSKSLESFGSAADQAFSLFKKSAPVIAGIYAVKKALDLTFEAETVRQINGLFETLTKEAGISGKVLQKGLIGAAGGLIDDTDLLQIANKSIISIGDNAAHLPKIMELARRATAAFGGDLKDNFEAFNNAIATGNTRSLKNIFNLTIDADKAQKEYATSIGESGKKLSEYGRQQAILNAVLTIGNEKFKDVDVDAKKATDTYQRLKVTLSQVGETATLAFESAFGNKTRGLLSGIEDAAKHAQAALAATFGEGSEKVDAGAELIRRKVKDLEVDLNDLAAINAGKKFSIVEWFSPTATSSAMTAIQERIKALKDELFIAEGGITQFANANTKLVEEGKKNTAALIDQSAAREAAQKAEQKLADEGKAISERLGGEDPNVKYEKDLEALLVFYEKKGVLDQSDFDKLDQRALERDLKLEEKASKEISDLREKNLALAAIDSEKYAADIAANEKLINDKVALHKKGSKLQIDDERAKAKAENDIQAMQANATIGILGNLANVAKAFGEEGFAAYKAIASAQALISAYQGAAAALAPPPVGVGPVFGPLLAATTIASGIATAVQINRQHFASGIDEIPPGFERDNFPAYLQTGERVVPRASNEKLTEFLDGDGPMIGLLASIDSKLSRLSTVVNIDGREVFNSMRSQLQSGRAFT